MIEPGAASYDGLAKYLAAETVLASQPQLVEFLPLGCYACDATGKVRWFNRKAAEFWGREPRLGDASELYCGSYKLYSLDGSIIRREQTPMAHVLRTGEPVSGGIASVERPDGTIIAAMVHIAPVKDAAGNLLGAINCFHDISAAQERERRHRMSEHYFRDLLNALPAAIYTTDAAGRVTFYNEAAAELAGRRPEVGRDEWCVTWELYNLDGSRLLHSECPMAVALKEERPVRGAEAILKRPDGALVPFLPYPTPLRDPSGRLVGAVNMLVDISHRKEAEALQRVLFAELNHRVKNNLQMLQGLLNSAVRETQNVEARRILSDAAQRIAAVSAAQRVLYQGNQHSVFAADAFVESLCRCIRDVLPKGVTLSCAADDVQLTNDVVMPLALIVNELVTNAAKHARDSEGNAEIQLRLTAEGSGYALHVQDSGPGFVWERGSRRSSGLGLVQGLVGQIGGQLLLRDGPGAHWTIAVHDGHARS